MNLSYWEQKSWFINVGFCIIGSGIVGLSCALQLKKKHPAANILILEKGILPQGASTKNAGFACFGSVSELLSDLKNHSENEVVDLVKQRVAGLELLKTTLGEKQIDYDQQGGYEVFLKEDDSLFENCKQQIPYLNELLYPVFKENVFHLKPDTFAFNKTIPHQIFNAFEGQIDTGKMMQALLKKVQSQGILILNSVEVKSVINETNAVEIHLKNFSFKAKQLFVATNAFASELLDVEVTPARNQVVITQPIENLHIKGSFHLDEGFYYFRNIHNRILLGGGRNIDKAGETTSKMGTTEAIQTALEDLLKNVILPNREVEIDQRWSGILGVGKQKKPIVKQVKNKVYCAVRLGGMGVAIGSQIGKDLANLME
ncbi:NAD(P)/FAD-dependent oxidoreductase [Psychroflexus salis]|uniref:FAD-dependent oxidoreductase n=1 Tax=Psychroflexus salis TaxID=1526574 RepID=A0A916ZTD0_9FLAO|nr:FAD-dependent oxidoreductase [Psychroflexus salis]GGE12221.1 FAD-dependent oxidoreductase [Psychroflexus salis]